MPNPGTTENNEKTNALEEQKTPYLYMAMLMDMVGAPYEFRYRNIFTTDFEFLRDFNSNGRYVFTDDSVMTAATADILMSIEDAKGEKSDKDIVETGVRKYKKYVEDYPNGTFPGGYGGDFVKWAKKEGNEPMGINPITGYASCGNGAGMRVSPVGWAYNTLEKTLHIADLTAQPSHSDPEGIKGAQAIAAAIYLARAGVNKDDIKSYLETKFDYDLDIDLASYRHYHKVELVEQTEVCPTTVPMAIRAFLEGDSYEDCGRKAISIGGDSDTIGAMTGGIAGAFYGMPKRLKEACEERLAAGKQKLLQSKEYKDREGEGKEKQEFILDVAKKFQSYIAERTTEPDMDEIDVALARARVEEYALNELRAVVKKQIEGVEDFREIGDQDYAKMVVEKSPREDPDFLKLLAEMEATRLFYDEVNAARDEKDASLQAALLYNKEPLVEKLKNQLMTSEELLKSYNEMDKWPTKMVVAFDYDSRKRDKENNPAKKTFMERRPQVDHALIPEKIVTKSEEYHKLMMDEIKKAKEEIQNAPKLATELTNKVGEILAGNGAENFYGHELTTYTKGYYFDIINVLDKGKGEIGQCFSEDKKPKLLESALEDLKQMKDSEKDTYKLYSSAKNKLEKLSKQLSETVTTEKLETVAQQIAFIDLLTKAADEYMTAPEHVSFQLRDEEAERMDEYSAKQQVEEINKYGKYTVLGQKTPKYYCAIVEDMLSEESMGAYFKPEELPEELRKASEYMKAGDTKSAMTELEGLSGRLNEKMLDDDKDELMKQETYVHKLMDNLEMAINAPDLVNDVHNAVYQKLNERKEQINGELVYLKQGKASELAKRAQEGLQNIQKAVVDDFNHDREDKAINALKKGDDYAAVLLYQRWQSYSPLFEKDPEQESDAAKKAEILEAKSFKDAFESGDLKELLSQMKKDVSYQVLEHNLSIFQLNTAMATNDGMLKAYKDVSQKATGDLFTFQSGMIFISENLKKASSFWNNSPEYKNLESAVQVAAKEASAYNSDELSNCVSNIKKLSLEYLIRKDNVEIDETSAEKIKQTKEVLKFLGLKDEDEIKLAKENLIKERKSEIREHVSIKDIEEEDGMKTHDRPSLHAKEKAASKQTDELGNKINK